MGSNAKTERPHVYRSTAQLVVSALLILAGTASSWAIKWSHDYIWCTITLDETAEAVPAAGLRDLLRTYDYELATDTTNTASIRLQGGDVAILGDRLSAVTNPSGKLDLLLRPENSRCTTAPLQNLPSLPEWRENWNLNEFIRSGQSLTGSSKLEIWRYKPRHVEKVEGEYRPGRQVGQAFYVPSKERRLTDSRIVLQSDKVYILEVSSVWSPWPHQKSGVDGAFVYRRTKPALLRALILKDPSIPFIDLIKLQTGSPPEYSVGHIYRSVLRGTGRTLKAAICEQRQSDNVGSLRLAIYEAVK